MRGIIAGMSVRVSCLRLVGRVAELAGLRDALDRVVGGTPAAVFVNGEAGVGKTRLVREFATGLFDEGVRVWSGGCAPLAEGLLPFAPVVDILRAVVADVGLPRLRTLAGSTTELIALLVPGLAEPTTVPVKGDVAVDQPRLFAALVSLFERLGDEATVLVVEDLHWADPSTCALLDVFVRGLRRGKLLLVCTYRDDELPQTHPMRSLLTELARGGADWVRLSRLDRAETAVQIAGILPNPPDQAFTDAVFTRSGGNPFLVEELLAAGPDAAGLSLGLRDILLTRVRRLPEATWRLLLAVALADRSADHALLAEVVGLSPEGALPGVRAAVEEHVLAVEGDRYVFRHALVAEAVIAEAMPDERIRLHREFAAVFAGRLAGVWLGPGAPAAALAAAHACGGLPLVRGGRTQSRTGVHCGCRVGG